MDDSIELLRSIDRALSVRPHPRPESIGRLRTRILAIALKRFDKLCWERGTAKQEYVSEVCIGVSEYVARLGEHGVGLDSQIQRILEHRRFLNCQRTRAEVVPDTTVQSESTEPQKYAEPTAVRYKRLAKSSPLRPHRYAMLTRAFPGKTRYDTAKLLGLSLSGLYGFVAEDPKKCGHDTRVMIFEQLAKKGITREAWDNTKSSSA